MTMLGLTQVFGKEKIVGIDIGSRFIKAVSGGSRAGRQARGASSKPPLFPTPHDSLCVTALSWTKAGVAGAVRAMLSGAGIDANAVVSAPFQRQFSVIVRHIKLPKMPESVLRKSVRFEAAKHISSSVEDSMIEFEITGTCAGRRRQNECHAGGCSERHGGIAPRLR